MAKRPVKKIPQPKFPKDWGKLKPRPTDVSSVEVNATCSHPFLAARPIRDTAEDIQALAARVDALVARWEDLTKSVECMVGWCEDRICREPGS